MAAPAERHRALNRATPGGPRAVRLSAMDLTLLELTPGPTVPLGPAISDARLAIRAAARDLLATRDSALERPWPWQGEEADVRYGLYRCLEAVEATEAD